MDTQEASIDYRLAKIENQQDRQASAMADLADELKQYIAESRENQRMMSEIMQTFARVEEKFNYSNTNIARNIEDIKTLSYKQTEQQKCCEQTQYRLDKVESSQAKLGERFEVTRDEHRDLKTKMWIAGIGIGLIVSPIIAFLTHKL